MNIRFIIHCTDDTQIQKKSQPKQKNPLLHRNCLLPVSYLFTSGQKVNVTGYIYCGLFLILIFYTRLPLILPFVKCNLDSPLVTFSIIEVVFLWVTGLSYSGGIIWMAIGSSKRGGLPFWYCGWSSSLLSGRLPANKKKY